MNGENNQNFNNMNNFNQPNVQNNLNQGNVPNNQNVPNQNNVPNNKPEKKSYCGLLLVFMAISLLLAGYIVCDKCLNKDEPKEPEKQDVPVEENKELVAFNENQFSEKDNVTEDGKEYFKVLTYKNNKLTLDFKFYTKSETPTDEGYWHEYLEVDMYINGVNKKTINVERFFHCDAKNNDEDCNRGFANIAEAKKYSVEKVKESLGTIKGDKYYLYLNLRNEDSSIYFINENGNILDNYKLKYASYNWYGVFRLTEECKTYEYGATDEIGKFGEYFIRTDAIYFLKLSKYVSRDNGSEQEYANEYKATVYNDKIVLEKIGTCQVSSEGEKPEDSDYEDM